MQKPTEVFHSTCDSFRKSLNVVLVQPESGGNVGSAARAMANMGIRGRFRIVGNRSIVNSDCRRMAKHAGDRVDQIEFFEDLPSALDFGGKRRLVLASTARIGSPHRPHPVRVTEGVNRALAKLAAQETEEIVFVFGRESDGLTNAEVELCDWIVTIPSSAEYRSLNLSQAVLLFCYEANRGLLEEWATFESPRVSQKQRLISHVVRLAEEVGFVLPGDPYKMKPRLEEILSHLPNHLKDVKTLHGLLDQTIRSVRRGGPDLRGRFRNTLVKRQSALENSPECAATPATGHNDDASVNDSQSRGDLA